MRRLLITTEGKGDVEAAKTATGLLIFAPQDVVGVVDSTAAGMSVADAFGVNHPAPIFGSVRDAARHGAAATHLVIGLAPSGGRLSPALRAHVVEAIEEGLSIISGLHTPLAEDPELAHRARARGVSMDDVRQPPPDIPVGSMRVLDWPVRRVLTIGTDCNVGKMSTSIRLVEGLNEAGADAVFVPTGQTGIMIAGWGIAVDRVISDFVTGAAELLIERVRDRGIAVVEGQGGILHPGFSAVTLGLLHGVLPEAMILCHKAGRERYRHTEARILPPREMVELYERIVAPLYPGRVVGCSLNTRQMPADQAQQEIARWRAATGLPVVDPFRDGVAPLVRAVQDRLGSAREPLGTSRACELEAPRSSEVASEG